MFVRETIYFNPVKHAFLICVQAYRAHPIPILTVVE